LRERVASFVAADLAVEKFLKNIRNEAIKVRLDFFGQNASQQCKVELNGPPRNKTIDSHKSVPLPRIFRLVVTLHCKRIQVITRIIDKLQLVVYLPLVRPLSQQ
jgi:hypothetical protein